MRRRLVNITSDSPSTRRFVANVIIKPVTCGGGRIAVSALSLFLASSGSAASDQPLSIHIAPSPIGTAEQGTELRVTLVVSGHQDGPLFLGFRDHWGPVIDVADNIHGFDVDNGSLKTPNQTS